MGSDANRNGAGPRSVRLTFRARFAALEKLFAIARSHGWVNAAGEPNLSAAVNHLIDQYDVKHIKPKDREAAHENAVEYLSKE